MLYKLGLFDCFEFKIFGFFELDYYEFRSFRIPVILGLIYSNLDEFLVPVVSSLNYFRFKTFGFEAQVFRIRSLQVQIISKFDHSKFKLF